MMALGKAAIRLGELNGAGHVHGGRHAHGAVRGNTGKREVPRLLVKEDVKAGEGDELVIARGHERKLLDLLGKPEEGAEVRVLEVALGDLLENAAHGLGGLGENPSSELPRILGERDQVEEPSRLTISWEEAR